MTITGTDDNIMNNNLGAVVPIDMEGETILGTGFGMNACIGADYDINELIFITGGLFIRHVSAKLESSKVTKMMINGVDQLPNMTTQDKEIKYVEEITSAANTVPTAPLEVQTEVVQMSSLTLNLGIGFKF